MLYLRAHVVETLPDQGVMVRDPTDAPILAAFVASKVDVLVSGEEDLLSLRGRFAVEAPAEFARQLV